MIIKIDHLALSSTDFEKHIKIMNHLGYKSEFIEKDIKNLGIKKKLMNVFSKRHDLALLSSKKNIPVELINHGHINSSDSYITPIFKKAEKIFNEVLIKTANIGKSIDFWSNFGFQLIKKSKEKALLQFSSPFNKSSFRMHLQKENRPRKNFFLDDKGFNCIAFISNSVKKEKEFLSKNGIETTMIEQSIINQKILSIFFAVGQQGELAEIISIKD